MMKNTEVILIGQEMIDMKKILERIRFWFVLYKWEKEKRREGFPKEWFENLND